MSLQVSNVRVPVEVSEEELPRFIAQRLGILEEAIQAYRILRKSLDARSWKKLKFVYSVIVDMADEADFIRLLGDSADVRPYQFTPFIDPEPGGEECRERPVVVGSGPAGLLAAYYLAQRGYRPIVIERGEPVKPRVAAIRAFDRGGPFDSENNYLFGEGGAGAFSDGKLTCRISGPDVDWTLDRMIDCGAPAATKYHYRPHLGSNRLPMIVRNFRRKIEALGGEYRFRCRLEGLDIADGVLRGIQTSGGYVTTSHVLLGIGHSARDTYSMLFESGIAMQAKPFQLGLRIEQPQDNVNRYKYGRPEYCDILGAADYTLIAPGERDVFTFCMCAGGRVIPSVSEPGKFCTNGMSNSRRDGRFANSGLVATIKPHEFGSAHPLAGVYLQQRYEATAFQIAGGEYHAPIQRAADFLKRRVPEAGQRIENSYERGCVPADLWQVLPRSIAKSIRRALPILDRKSRGALLQDAHLFGPEMRGSSPVRIVRDEVTRQSPACRGLYPIGEGAGFAGGIMSAAVDGLQSAKQLVQQFAPPA